MKNITVNQLLIICFLRVYQRHNYYVSQNNTANRVLVHNPNGVGCNLTTEQLAFLQDNTDTEVDKVGNKVNVELYLTDEFSKKYPSANIEFNMSFEDSNWTFISFKREGMSDHNIRANHFTTYIIKKAKEKYPDLVTLQPKLITHDHVVNEETLRALHNLGSNPEHEMLLNTFLTTPNGKYTARVVNDFGLEVRSIEVGNLNYNANLDEFMSPAPNITLGVKPAGVGITN